MFNSTYQCRIDVEFDVEFNIEIGVESLSAMQSVGYVLPRCSCHLIAELSHLGMLEFHDKKVGEINTAVRRLTWSREYNTTSR